jgi:hypothetical protein
VEGPFDALKLDFYGRSHGLRAVALSTNSVSEQQANLLAAADDQFARKLVMMDNASSMGIADSMRLRQELAFLTNVKITKVPYGKKDAGDLTPSEVETWSLDQGAR